MVADHRSRDGARLKVLLVEDNQGDAEIVRMALAGATSPAFEVVEVQRLSEALHALDSASFDVVILDLSLPDSQRLPTFTTLHARHPALPVVVLTGLDDETAALGAVRLGAQDYLVKGEYDEAVLARSLRYAVERGRIIAQLERVLSHLRGLDSHITVCAWCRRIRDAKDSWISVEDYLASRTNTAPSHGICPECRTQIQKH
jgi:DNA-binding NarL/FixJ family response regulator